MKKLDCVCFGSMVFDYRTRMRPKRFSETAPLRVVTNPEDHFVVGGIPILAMAMARLGLSVAVMGRVGRDLAGHGLVGYLSHECGIDTEGVSFSPQATGYSVIRLTRRERYVNHFRGANAACTPDRRMLSLIRGHRPCLAAIGYAGLLPELDANDGEGMARFISQIGTWGIIAALDTHTVGKGYRMLRRPLPLTDVFVCNEEEGRRISGEATPERMLTRIAGLYPRKDRKARRLLGITVPDGAHLAYGADTDLETGFVASPWYTSRPADLTGAGDAFRAGLYSYLISNRRSFTEGRFDWRQAGLLANLVAATVVTEGLEGVDAYPRMMQRCGERPRTQSKRRATKERT